MPALFVAAFLTSAAPTAIAQSGEDALKAAFLYNFALYTEWPTLSDTFAICLVGKNGLGEAAEALSRREVSGRPVRVFRIDHGQAQGNCNLVFVQASASEHSAKLIASLAGKPVLTITEGKSGESTKAMLHLSSDQGRLSFEASQTAARAAGLVFSSKLLRLARSVN